MVKSRTLRWKDNYIGIVGYTNVGKSALVNALLDDSEACHT